MARKTITADKIHDRLRILEDRANVSAYVILNAQGHHVGTVRFHHPRDGAGRLTCSAADWTIPVPENGNDRASWTRWQLGWANGYGYDKRTAAMVGMSIAGVKLKDNGHGWDSQLRDAGLIVVQAI